MASKDQKLELIRGVPLFGGCRGRDLEQIGRLADTVEVPAGEILLREGRTAHEFYIIVEGTVRVERGGATVARLGPGEFAGEIALIDGGPRNATVIAETPATLLVLGHREFHALMQQYPSIQLTVLQALAQRVRAAEPDAIL